MCNETKGPPHKSEANQKVCKSSTHLCLTPQACTHNQIPGSLQVITIRIRTVVVIHRHLIGLYPWPNCPFRTTLRTISQIHSEHILLQHLAAPICPQKARSYKRTLSITAPLLSEEFSSHAY